MLAHLENKKFICNTKKIAEKGEEITGGVLQFLQDGFRALESNYLPGAMIFTLAQVKSENLV